MKLPTRINLMGDKYEVYAAHHQLLEILARTKKTLEKEYKINVVFDYEADQPDRKWSKWLGKGAALTGQGIKEGLKALDKLDDGGE